MIDLLDVYSLFQTKVMMMKSMRMVKMEKVTKVRNLSHKHEAPSFQELDASLRSIGLLSESLLRALYNFVRCAYLTAIYGRKPKKMKSEFQLVLFFGKAE